MNEDVADASRGLHSRQIAVSVTWLRRLAETSLATQFFVVGGTVSLAVMIGIGLFVANQIKSGVTQNSAAATALYVDSVIAPLLPDMQSATALDESVIRALDETLDQGALGRRILTFRLWAKNGTLIYSNTKEMIGRQFEPNANLRAAFLGSVVAEFDELDDVESGRERASGLPLLEVYNPVRQPWSGEVVGVTEFYEVANDLKATLRKAAIRSWAAVAGGTLGFFLLLSAVVIRGSRIIESQRGDLRTKVDKLSQLLSQNRSLRRRVQKAAQRTVAQNELHLRRIGADLHDGPAQLIALASLELDSLGKRKAGSLDHAKPAIRGHLDEAIAQIRAISGGLILPNIDRDELADVIRRAVREHERRTGMTVALQPPNRLAPLSSAAKLCIYRVLQESLGNSAKHAPRAKRYVNATVDERQVRLEIGDDGPGFNLKDVRSGGLGMTSIKERVESLGGGVDFASSDAGTVVTVILHFKEENDSHAK